MVGRHYETFAALRPLIQFITVSLASVDIACLWNVEQEHEKSASFWPNASTAERHVNFFGGRPYFRLYHQVYKVKWKCDIVESVFAHIFSVGSFQTDTQALLVWFIKLFTKREPLTYEPLRIKVPNEHGNIVGRIQLQHELYWKYNTFSSKSENILRVSVRIPFGTFHFRRGPL